MTDLSQLDKNLLLFLDPVGRYSEQVWEFYDGPAVPVYALSSPGRNVVVRYSRNNMAAFIAMFLKMLFIGKGKSRTVLFVRDRLFSSIFDSSSLSAYKAFAKNHLQKPKTIRQRIISKLFVAWRAETRFIVVINAVPQEVSSKDSGVSCLEVNDFMFFSNAAGKLLLTTGRTLETGHGTLVKTTTDPAYIPVMAQEFETVSLLSGRLGKAGCLPEIGKHLAIGARHFFTEEYILGESLHESLRVLGGRGDFVQIFSLLDHLDVWFMRYNASFYAPKVPIASLYNHLFSAFSACYGANGESLLRTGVELLRCLENAYPLVMPVTAHNDLWPGNIVMTESGFVVIDWERATEHRAPFFDYFWMVVSTTIDALAGESDCYEYAVGVNKFLRCDDEVSCHAFQMLKEFLNRFEIAEEYLPHLLFLFFMEWSVQGFMVLGRQSDMDRLAFDELLVYADMVGTIHEVPESC